MTRSSFCAETSSASERRDGMLFRNQMCADRRRERNMADALAADRRARDFDAALIAHHALIADAAIFTAVAFVILGRTEDALAEQAILFRTLGAVVDRFRLDDLAMRPAQDIFRRCDA